MFCENEDCTNELTPHQVADGESFCSDQCRTEHFLLDGDSDWWDDLWDDPYEDPFFDDDEDLDDE